MKMKKIAIRCFIVLFVLVFACLFFGKTLETLTTAKARFQYSNNGRIQKENKYIAKLFYTSQENVFIKSAEKFPITITGILFDAGSKVSEGEVLLTAKINDYEKKAKDIQDEIVKKTQELLDLDTKNAKLPTNSEKNVRYDRMLKANEALIKAKAEEKSKARLEKRDPDENAWKEQQNAYNVEEASYKQYALVSSSSYQDELFEYVKKRNELISAISEKEQEAIDLDFAKTNLSLIKVEKSGLITKLETKPGESYDGSKALYSISPDETPPVLRALLNPQDELPEVGDKVRIKTEWSTKILKVSDAGRTKEGQKFFDVAINNEFIYSVGGIKELAKMEEINVSISTRAKESTTIIPSSALRQDGENYYVYLAEFKSNGLLGGYYQAKKERVTVLATSDKNVSIAEDLNGYIIDREDRPLQEGTRVIEIKE